MNSAIVYLLRSTLSDTNDIIKSINSLYTNFILVYDYPIYIFIEDSFKQDWINLIYSSITMKQNIFFQNIKFNIPQFFSDQNINVPTYMITHNGSQRWPIGYRHMCRFWSGSFLENEIIKKYDYIWRMDSDAYITSPITFDVFLNMYNNNTDYAYSSICHDEHEVCEGLYEFSEKYFKNNVFKWNRYLMYTTHVEIFNIKRFQQSDYINFFNAIDNTTGFYIKRWGDAPIRYIAITNMQFNTNKLNINYIHGNDGSGRREQEINENCL